MKKVLIISYFYPPSIFVGGQRTAFWAKHLHQFGYYPIVVTRNWNERQTTLTETVENNDLKIEKHQNYEVHRLPYRRSFRDICADRPSLKYFQKILTLWELFASNYSVKALPYSNFYSYCEDLIREQDISAILISGRPFQQFHFGYRLKKKYQTKWIADYRDEWNSHYRLEPKGVFWKMITALERKSEKRWLSNADHITTVSEAGLARLQRLLSLNGSVIKNGFESTEVKVKKQSGVLKILYAGTLYPYQDLSIIFESIKSIASPQVQFHLIGGFDTLQLESSYNELVKKFPEQFFYTQKLPRDEFISIMRQMDIGILTPYKNLDGCLPVKIFDYYSHGLELLLCPSDNDLMEQFITETNAGVVLKSKTECATFLKSQLEKKQVGGEQKPRDYNLGKEYSRMYQTQLLGKVLDKLTASKDL